MATIGTFKKVGTDYQGEIFTLGLRASGVRVVAETSSNPDAPSHRIMAGRAEIGAAFARTSKQGRPYHSVKLDDPSLPAPIYANLFDNDDGETANLVWTRPAAKNGD